MGKWLLCAVAMLTISLGSASAAQPLRIAVAANFIAPARQIAERFESETEIVVSLSSGSTGQLFAQIANGAPFSVFLAADQIRPRLAVERGYAVIGSRRTYALGRLVLYGSDASRSTDLDALRKQSFRRLAIANPKTAPYGLAAIQVLQELKLSETLRPKFVVGNSIAQTFQFVRTKNAEYGFVAASQVSQLPQSQWFLVPSDLHAPIAQDAVLLERGASDTRATRFLEFLHSTESAAVLTRYGYELPQ